MSMGYSFLTSQQQEALRIAHVSDLEADHYRISLQIKDAADDAERENRQRALEEVERRIQVHIADVAQRSDE